MKPPVWLAELHRQWLAARGRRLSAAKRAFSRPWLDLLEAAGVAKAEDQETALREAFALEKQGRLKLGRHAYRTYMVERVTLPLESEHWLRELFASNAPQSLRDRSLDILRQYRGRPHPLYPQLWEAWCGRLLATFAAGRMARPLRWSEPEMLAQIFSIIFKLTEKAWPAETPIRSASVALGLDSKALERHRRTWESALSQLFGRPTALEALGIAGPASHVWMSGPATLILAHGETINLGGLQDRYALSAADLAHAVAIRTPAQRLLTVENEKTTFRQLAAANRDRQTLLAATSFPTGAARLLLAKLDPALPRFHFGDTDAAGWSILMKLRECSPSPIAPFKMHWRAAPESGALTEYDRMLLPKLLSSETMADCRAEIEALLASGQRGDFEQESLGPPASDSWPFYRE